MQGLKWWESTNKSHAANPPVDVYDEEKMHEEALQEF